MTTHEKQSVEESEEQTRPQVTPLQMVGGDSGVVCTDESCELPAAPVDRPESERVTQER